LPETPSPHPLSLAPSEAFNIGVSNLIAGVKQTAGPNIFPVVAGGIIAPVGLLCRKFGELLRLRLFLLLFFFVGLRSFTAC